LKTVCQTGDLQKEKNRLEEELAVLAETMNYSVKENAHLAQNQNEYQKRYNGLVEKYDAVKDQYDKVSDAITAKEMQGVRLEHFIKELKAQDGIIQEFDDRLWGILVDFVTVSQDKKFTVTFKDGTEIQA
jgi:chromosome segregation ATPase